MDSYDLYAKTQAALLTPNANTSPRREAPSAFCGVGGTGPQYQPCPPAPASPVERVLGTSAQLTGQVECLVDELVERLRRGGVVQDLPVNVGQPAELPPPSCALVGQLLEHAGHLERLSLQLQTLLQQLAL